MISFATKGCGHWKTPYLLWLSLNDHWKCLKIVQGLGKSSWKKFVEKVSRLTETAWSDLSTQLSSSSLVLLWELQFGSEGLKLKSVRERLKIFCGTKTVDRVSNPELCERKGVGVKTWGSYHTELYAMVWTCFIPRDRLPKEARTWFRVGEEKQRGRLRQTEQIT